MLSVVVVSYNSYATLDQCLESLTSQIAGQVGGPSVGPGGEKDEIIVADCSDEDPRLHFRQQFPGVRFLRFEEPLTIPELRREALKVAKGEIIALTEGRVVPSLQWAARLLQAHTTHPQAPAVGGPIDYIPASASDNAVYFCEYGRHLPPTGDGEAAELSGANLSYKRWALDLCRDLIQAGAWEPFLHRRLEERGYRLYRAGEAVVYYHNSLSPSQFARQRFHYGRWFAAARVKGPRRLLYAGFCPLLPWLLTWRLGRVARERPGQRGLFRRSLPWIVLFEIIWSLGEFCGYVAGKGTSDRKIF